MIEGVIISMGGQEYEVPALNLRGIRERTKDLDLIQQIDPDNAFSEDRFDAIVRVAHTALVRNYPEITEDDLRENIDMNNVRSLIDAVLGQSGLKKGDIKPGET